MAIIDSLNTLEGKLVDLKDLLITNLKTKGIGGATTSNTLTQLANMVLDIEVGGAEYDLDLVFSRLDNTGKVSFRLNGETITASTTSVKANLSDYGIDELTSFSFANSTISEINAFADTSKVTSLNSVFSYSNLKNLDISNWNLDSLSDVSFAFSYAQDLETISYDRNKFAQFPKVNGLFGACSKLKSGFFSPSDVTEDMSYMFYDCSSMLTCNISTLDEAKPYYAPTNVSNLFRGCSNLGGITLSYMNWNKVTDASYMFYGCSSMSIPRVGNTQRPSNLLTNTSYMFADTTFDILQMNNLTYGNLWEGWFGNARIENAAGMFKNANINGHYEDTQELDVISWATKDTSSMFEGCVNMTGCIIANNPQSLENCSRMFAGCTNLTYIGFNGLSSENITDASGMFDGCSSLSTLHFDNSPSCSAQEKILAALEEAGLTSQVTVEGLKTCGGGAQSDVMVLKLKEYTGAEGSIGDSGFEADYDNGSVFVTTLSQLGESSSFSRMTVPNNATHILSLPSSDSLTFIDINCEHLEYANLSMTNLSNVDTFSLGNCWNLKYLDLSNWQNRNLYSGPFFSNAMTNLKAIKMLNCSDDVKSYIQTELSNEGLDNVLIITEDNNKYFVFEPNTEGYHTIIKVNDNEILNQPWVWQKEMDDSNSLNGNSVNNMFAGSSHLTVYTTPPLSATTGHWSMFTNCGWMKGIDLSTWDINFVDNNQDINSMFEYCTSLEWVNLSNWDLTNAYNEGSMFNNCNKLKYVIAYNCNDATISKLESALSNYDNVTLYKTQE